MKMRGIKLIGVVSVAAFGLCLSAVSAMAEELPLLLPSPASASATWGADSLRLESSEVQCGKGASTFGAESDTLGTFKIRFSECKGGGRECVSLGQTAGSGVIETAGTFHLVRLMASRTHFLLWFLLSPVDNANAIHIECEVFGLVLIWGSFLALILVKSELTWKFDIEREGTGSSVKQRAGQTEFVNNAGEVVHVTGVRGKFGVGVERAVGAEYQENLLHWNTDVTIMLP